MTKLASAATCTSLAGESLSSKIVGYGEHYLAGPETADYAKTVYCLRGQVLGEVRKFEKEERASENQPMISSATNSCGVRQQYHIAAPCSVPALTLPNSSVAIRCDT